MLNIITINKGLNLNLIGEASGEVLNQAGHSGRFAIFPDDYEGLTPKMLKKEGDLVAAGEPVFFDKNHPEIIVASPVSGTIGQIERGERRKIIAIRINADGKTDNKKTFPIGQSSENPERTLLESGLWAMLKQRPYGIVPDPEKAPRDIFVSTFDSSPLAPEHTLYIDGNEEYFMEGIRILSTMTDGKVYIGCRKERPIETEHSVTTIFEGPHPAGNIGTQIACIKPVNKDENVWEVDAETVVRIGHLFTKGFVDYSCIIAVTGESVKTPAFVRATAGAALEDILKGNISGNGGERIISGNVLTGTKENLDGYLHFPFRQITVIPEISDDCEMLGWASLSPRKYSASRTFLSWLTPKKKYHFDAKINGGERAIIMAGEYDKVFPMDIYVEFLIKAILARDIDKMEQLGIYEVIPEDFALCEFIDTSKLELQKIVREGLDFLRKETN